MTGNGLRFGILGSLTVWREGTEVRLTGRRARTVLARLLVSPGKDASVDELVEALYPTVPPRSARNQVQLGVKGLRECGIPIETLDESGYALFVDLGQVDACVFERLYEQAQTQPDHHAAETLREALRLWRGPVFREFPGPVFEAAADRLCKLQLTALTDRIEADLAIGRHRLLLHELRGLIAKFPYRERLTSQLMLALYRVGCQYEALQLYATTRNRFVDELGIEPGHALRNLHHRILNQDPALNGRSSETS